MREGETGKSQTGEEAREQSTEPQRESCVLSTHPTPVSFLPFLTPLFLRLSAISERITHC